MRTIVFPRTGKTDESVIELVLEDWREVDGVRLPFSVRIDDGEREFQYRFTDVSLNEGSVDELKAQVDAN